MENELLKEHSLDEAKRQRVLQLMEHLSVSQSGLAKLIHMSQGYISHIASGKKPLTRKFVRHLREYAGVNIEWLLTGTGEMFDPHFDPSRISAPPETQSYPSPNELHETGRMVPLINIPQHGSPLGTWEDASQRAYMLRLPPVINPEIDTIFRVSGHALYPRIKPDALLFARRLPTVVHLPSGTEHIYILFIHQTLKVGYINNHHEADGKLTLFFADYNQNMPECLATDEIERVWYAALVLQLP